MTFLPMKEASKAMVGTSFEWVMVCKGVRGQLTLDMTERADLQQQYFEAVVTLRLFRILFLAPGYLVLRFWDWRVLEQYTGSDPFSKSLTDRGSW